MTSVPQLAFVRLDAANDLPLPAYQSSGAAGLDLRADVPEGETLDIEPGGRALIGTGFAVVIPSGFEGQVRPRSGLAAKQGLTVLNTPGTIDSDYRGELKVLLINLGEETASIGRGMRIAQLVVAPVVQAVIHEAGAEALGETGRGVGGFGSTGTG